MVNLAKMTPRQNAQFWYMSEAMRRFEWDLHNKIELSGHIPKEWHDIAKAPPERRRKQVNIGLDEEVLKFFKSLGKGYGGRINLVLRAFMHAKLAGVIEGPETLNHYRQWEEVHDHPKPQFGDIPREMGQDWEDAPGEETRAQKMARGMEVLRRAKVRRDGGGE